jgi:signal transduction histidine kinase
MSLADFITFCGANRDTILGLNGLLSSIMAIVLLWLYYRVLREQKWAKYFGWGFAVFALQYLTQWITHLLYQFARVTGLKGGAEAIVTVGDFAQDLGSIINNILFFVAASALLALSVRFTYWVIGVSGVILVLNLMNQLGVISLGDWSRVPDKALAFLCLALLGWGFFLNIRVLLSRGLAALFLAGIWLYAVINLLYAFIPFIVRFNWPLNAAVQHDITKLKELVVTLTLTQSYDAVILAVAILVKVALFSAGLVLMIRSIVMLHPDSYRTTLSGVAEGNQEFLSSYGIVHAIARNFGADFAEICLRVPGLEKRRVVWWRWLREPSTQAKTATSWWRRSQTDLPLLDDWAGFEVGPSPDPAGSIVGRVLVNGKQIISRDWQTDSNVKEIYLENVPGMKSFVTVPIRYHKAVVGALNLEWRKARAFNETIVLQIQRLAAFLAPVIQSERQLGAVDQFAYRLPRLELEDKNDKKPLTRRVEVFHDTMSPLATGIAIELGFRQIWAGCNDHGSTGDRIVDSGSIEKLLAEEVTRLSSRGADHVRLEKVRLTVKNMRIGTLRIAYPARSDEEVDVSRPMLGANYLHRRTVAALVADALFDSIRSQLAATLNELHLALHSQEVDSTQKWLDTIEQGVQKTGLLWAVARTSGSQNLLGGKSGVAIVEYLIGRDGKERLFSPVITVLGLSSSMEGTHHVIALPVPAATSHLWLGVSRKGFGTEAHQAPWNEFLERLAEGAGAALLRVVATLEFQRMALEQARYQGLQTTLVTMGTMTHQLANFMRGFSSSVLNLEEALQTKRLQTDDITALSIQEMSRSVLKLSDLLKPLTSMTIMNQRRPCNLREVIDHAYELHRFLFQQKRTSFTVQGLGDQPVLIDIPYDVATLALANLISNSLDAIEADGSIEIQMQTDRNGGMVRCHVIDNGRGVPDLVRSSDPFRLGVTSRDGSGGWGLYLTKRSLMENQANVEMTKPGPGGTIFTLSFRGVQNAAVAAQSMDPLIGENRLEAS